ncbi:hypothetical protein QFC20_006358 [Naganishia adeliensis]|uniref:Uncharacterized protein n=1 Tax=Naganishia adeliensis TaxID=92952 RepID=A0ACC2VCH2_9TREE|nr:hypothetical protein QFC20_006358 [Naganishia adeliensis]
MSLSRSRSPSPSAKRIKLTHQASTATTAYPAPDASLEALIEQEMALPIEVRKTYNREIEYENKLVLAPMVRTGSLPMRLLSLHYGAGLVWGPEIVDKAIIGAERIVDPVTGVISYTKKGGDGKPIFTCHPIEKPFLIYQIGTSDPELAVAAAKTVEQDVAGFDLNCGCPKPFSEKTGVFERGAFHATRRLTLAPGGASSVMIARAAESNPSIFHPSGPISTMESLIPTHFLPLCAYINNHYSNTKFLLYQFKPSPSPISTLSKAERKRFSDGIAAAKTIDQAVAVLRLDHARRKGTRRPVPQRP